MAPQLYFRAKIGSTDPFPASGVSKIPHRARNECLFSLGVRRYVKKTTRSRLQTHEDAYLRIQHFFKLREAEEVEKQPHY